MSQPAGYFFTSDSDVVIQLASEFPCKVGTDSRMLKISIGKCGYKSIIGLFFALLRVFCDADLFLLVDVFLGLSLVMTNEIPSLTHSFLSPENLSRHKTVCNCYG